MTEELERFLKDDASKALLSLSTDIPPSFGKMNVLQMLEHLSEWISISSGDVRFPLQTPEQDLVKWKSFLLSDKEFRPNTPNSLLSDEPPKAQITNTKEGVELVQIALNKYFERFIGKELETETHPFFGPLNFEEWAVLHAKHIRHHLRQFGVAI